MILGDFPKMVRRKVVIVLLAITVLAPIVLYTDRLGSYIDTSLLNGPFVEDGSSLKIGSEVGKLNAISQEFEAIKEPTGLLHADPVEEERPSVVTNEETPLSEEQELSKETSGEHEHKSRVLSFADDDVISDGKGAIRQVIVRDANEHKVAELQRPKEEAETKDVHPKIQMITDPVVSERKETRSRQHSDAVNWQEVPRTVTEKNPVDKPLPDARVRQLRDQLIRAKVYLSIGSTRSNPVFMRELRLRIKDVQRAVGDATKDSELPRNLNERLRLMEQTLAKGKKLQDDCSASIKKLRAILHSAEEQLRVHEKQTLFLTQLAAKTLPKGLHCLPLRLSTEYYSLNHSQQEFSNKEKLENPKFYHYALFSDNVLAAATVVNSTIFHARDPANHVFHVVTDRLNYAAMRMWFLANPPGMATIQVQNIKEFTWLNSSYSTVLKQLGSASMIDYYFRTHRANSDSNLKFRNPKYLSILNHLRFYLPEIFPKLNKVLFLDDDIVVQRDLTDLWKLNLKGKVNGAVETCGENFHRFDRYLNFSNPLIARNFDPHACGWAYGMNVFDLKEWRNQNITEVYHSWQNLNHDRLLWKLGTLPPGLITFYNRTFSLDQGWHVLGLGYNPSISQRKIERAAVIHYNGNLKPWLEIGIPKYRHYWAKFLNYDQLFLRDCNINP